MLVHRGVGALEQRLGDVARRGDRDADRGPRHDRCRPATRSPPATASASRRPNSSGSTEPRGGSATTTNSSPPTRATVSSPRTAVASRVAVRRRISSPAACPSRSLTSLKPSRSIIATNRSWSSRRRRRARWWARRSARISRLAAPVSESSVAASLSSSIRFAISRQVLACSATSSSSARRSGESSIARVSNVHTVPTTSPPPARSGTERRSAPGGLRRRRSCSRSARRPTRPRR